MELNEQKPLTIRELPVNSITVAAYNPRQISDAAFEGLKESLKKFGMPSPLVINKRSGVLVSGHQRLKAATALGWPMVPVVEVDLSPAEEKALNVTLNNRHISGDFTAGLAEVLDDVRMELGDDFMAALRLDDIEIPEIEFGDDEGEAPDEPAPAPPVEPKSKLGDLWTLGKHRVICGDSTDALVVAKLLGDAKPNLMVTDPPYGVSYEAGWRADAKDVEKTEREENSNLQNDTRADWYDAWALFPGDVAYVWHASSFTDVVMDSLRRAGFRISQQIIWNKNVHALSRSHYHWKHEPCWFAVREGKDAGWRAGRDQMTVWDVKNVMHEGDKTAHPTQKPLPIFEIAIRNHTQPGDWVFEPFGGSGTQVIACEKLGRKSLTIELDPRYVDVILTRFVKHTGQDPIRDDGKKWSELQ